MTDLKKLNPNLKVLLSIGNIATDVFSTAASQNETRRTLAKSSRHFMETYNFDGIDVDWERPFAKDRVGRHLLLAYI